MTILTEEAILEEIAAEIRRQANAGGVRLDIERVLAISGWGRRQTERLFRDRFLTSPVRYFRDCQTENAERLLSNGDDVLSASTKSGFASPGRLHDALLSRRGLTPGEVRRGGEGVHLDFGFFHTQLGVILLVATSRGLCSLRICGSNPSKSDLAEKVAELRNDYPRAELNEDTVPLQGYADQLVAFLERRSANFCPPLDIFLGTTFQREVWAELQKIQPGETISYKELANRLGRPDSVRAVASACAANCLAIAIPCHRVIRQDGTLAGYRWGVEWKRRLLQLEADMRRRENSLRMEPALALD
ncbi:MAG TPA: methylated-DNA--[protein]-cysteine S-methyltransferase [Aggregatilineales bacterium]|nr:methylated-DNA--[protein]-cysteine S-methyltransferase [Aggregatilineales bacterium]